MYLLQMQKVKLVQKWHANKRELAWSSIPGRARISVDGSSRRQPLYPFVLLVKLRAAAGTTHYFSYRKHLGCYLSFDTHFVLGQHARAAMLVYLLEVG